MSTVVISDGHACKCTYTLTPSGIFGGWDLLVILICLLHEKNFYIDLCEVKTAYFHFSSGTGVLQGDGEQTGDKFQIYYNVITG
jgi:hypothetical protein